MSSPLTFLQVMTALECNQQFLGAYGPSGEPALTKEEKNQICGIITKKLANSLHANGEEFFSELWPIVLRSLGTCNWFARKKDGALFGPYVLWSVIYRKASLTAQQKIESRPKAIGPVAQQVVDEIFKKKQQEAFS